MSPAVWLFASYLIGSIPNSYLAGRLARGIDLREHGSGNLGATNTFRVLGAGVAAPVLLLDVVKGFVPVAFFPRWDDSVVWAWALGYGAAAILGHVFSIYLGFRGGKGVATAAGVFLALAPLAIGIAALAWIVVLFLTRIVSLASILAAIALPVALWIGEPRVEVLLLGLGVAAFVVVSHRANMRRLMRGEEHRFGRKKMPVGEEETR